MERSVTLFEDADTSKIKALERLKLAACFVLSALKPEIPDIWPSKPPRIGKTTYLDGLRGIAAMMVYFGHHSMYAHQDPSLHRAFGWHGRYHFVTFPGVRLGWSGGNLAVGLFLTISGYVCSLSPLKMLHKGELLKLSNSLGATLPRRFFRLYYPTFWITFSIVTTWHIFDICSSNNGTSPPKENYVLELQSWLTTFFHDTYLWSGEPGISGNGTEFSVIHPHLWYIPAQFRGMFMLNAITGCLMAFHEWGTTARLWALSVATFYFLVIADGWYIAMSTMGMLAADFDLLNEKEELPNFLQRLPPLPQWLWHLVLIVGLYLGGCPRGIHDIDNVAANDPGWGFVGWLTPRNLESFIVYWEFWAAIFVMLAIPRIPWLRSCLEMSIPLYLAKLSFGIYLVHGPVMFMLGARVYAAVGRVHPIARQDIAEWWINLLPLPDWGPLGLEVNYIAAQAILIPITFWFASIVHKVLDEPSGRIGNWLFDPN